MIHRETSIEVYRRIEAEGLLSDRRWEVYSQLYQYGPATAAELAEKFPPSRGGRGLAGNVHARLGELRDRGVVVEMGPRMYRITGNRVIVYDVTAKLPSEATMSAKNIKGASDPLDRYFTPAWATDQFVEEVLRGHQVMPPLPDKRILEPGAGEGSIVRGLRQAFPHAHIAAVDIDPELGPWEDANESYEGDFLDIDWEALYAPQGNTRKLFDLVAGNPPYTLAQRFVEVGLEVSDRVLFLTRQGFLATSKRCFWLRDHRPTDVFILPNRPAFSTPGVPYEPSNTDSADYCWVLWGPGVEPTRMHWLNDVPKEKRR